MACCFCSFILFERKEGVCCLLSVVGTVVVACGSFLGVHLSVRHTLNTSSLCGCLRFVYHELALPRLLVSSLLLLLPVNKCHGFLPRGRDRKTEQASYGRERGVRPFNANNQLPQDGDHPPPERSRGTTTTTAGLQRAATSAKIWKLPDGATAE